MSDSEWEDHNLISDSEPDNSDDEDFVLPTSKRKKAAKKTTKKKKTPKKRKTPVKRKKNATKSPPKKKAKKTSSENSPPKSNTVSSGKAKTVKASKVKKKLSGNALESEVLEYIEKKNRPHSDKEMWDNMHRPCTQAQMKKTLLSMAKDGALSHFQNGKFNVFWANQGQYSDISLDTLSELDADIERLTEEVRQSQQGKKQISATVTKLRSLQTFSELQVTDKELDGLLAVAEEKLKSLTSDEVVRDPKAREKLSTGGKKLAKLWRQRRSKVKDVVDQFSEGMGIKVKAAIEKLGLETGGETGGPSYKDALLKLKELTR